MHIINNSICWSIQIDKTFKFIQKCSFFYFHTLMMKGIQTDWLPSSLFSFPIHASQISAHTDCLQYWDCWTTSFTSHLSTYIVCMNYWLNHWNKCHCATNHTAIKHSLNHNFHSLSHTWQLYGYFYCCRKSTIFRVWARFVGKIYLLATWIECWNFSQKNTMSSPSPGVYLLSKWFLS